MYIRRLKLWWRSEWARNFSKDAFESLIYGIVSLVYAFIDVTFHCTLIHTMLTVSHKRYSGFIAPSGEFLAPLKSSSCELVRAASRPYSRDANDANGAWLVMIIRNLNRIWEVDKKYISSFCVNVENWRERFGMQKCSLRGVSQSTAPRIVGSITGRRIWYLAQLSATKVLTPDVDLYAADLKDHFQGIWHWLQPWCRPLGPRYIRQPSLLGWCHSHLY